MISSATIYTKVQGQDSGHTAFRGNIDEEQSLVFVVRERD